MDFVRWDLHFRDQLVLGFICPSRKVVAMSGDGGFLMNVQELETAVPITTSNHYYRMV